MNVANRPQESGSIRFLTGPLAGSTFQISKPIITFGREPDNDIVIADPTVSRQHARLVNNAGQWSIEKLVAQNVVTVNQHNVQQAVIANRDTIGLGEGTTFLFLISSPPSPAGQRPAVTYNAIQTPPTPIISGQQPQARYSFTEAASPQLVALSQHTPTNEYHPGTIEAGQGIPVIPTLEISSNIHAEKQAYPLAQQVINIGRDPSNDIVINELVISAFHAQIVREGNQLVLIHPHPA